MPAEFRQMARKRFGQNFLRDPRIIERIVSALRPEPGQHLVEIGPGQGAITAHLMASGAQLTVVEIDRELAALLPQQDWWKPETRLLECDALKVDWNTLQPQPLRVVGNLPYNISTPLLFALLSTQAQVQDLHLMLQKEVVQRLAASPGSEAWGRLSVAAQLRARVEVLIDVPPGAFWPAPKVQSQVIRVQPLHPAPELPQSLDALLRAAFSARRKTLRKALGGQVQAELWEQIGIDPGLRAEVLDLQQWLRLGFAVDEASGYTRVQEPS